MEASEELRRSQAPALSSPSLGEPTKKAFEGRPDVKEGTRREWHPWTSSNEEKWSVARPCTVVQVKQCTSHPPHRHHRQGHLYEGFL